MRLTNIAACLLASWIAATPSAEADTRVDTARLGQRIEAMVKPYVELRDFSGTILVAQGDEVLFARGFGKADFELVVENTPTTRFMIGSISKQFTAAAVLALEVDGRLNVTDAVSKHVPDYPRGDEITIHHLLTHRSGIADIYTLEQYGSLKHADPTLAQVVAQFQQLPLDFEPGSQYSYCNSGYTLLAHIIELTSGMSYSEFMTSRVFQPAGMEDSGASQDRAIVEGLATGYDPLGQQGLRRAIEVAPALLTGSGSVYSTADDLLQWHRALSSNAVLPDSSRTKMMSSHGSSYGYGVSVFERFGGKVIEHDGRLPGYACDLARYLDIDAVVIILGNVQSSMRDRLRDDIASLIHGEEPDEREVRTVNDIAVDPADLEALEGKYSFGPNFFVMVRAGGSYLSLAANRGEESEFFPVGEGEYFSRALYAGARFEIDEQGKPVAMEYIREGRSFRGEYEP